LRLGISVQEGAAMRQVFLRLAAATFVLSAFAACTATGSSTSVQGSSGSSGTPLPGFDDSTQADGGTALPTDNTGPIDYASLFGPPASTDATPNSLSGLWAGTDSSSRDTRITLAGTSIIIANKCGSATTGVTVVARVTSSSIKTLESKSSTPSSSGTSNCSISITPVESVRCTSTTESDAQYEATNTTGGCFLLNGTTLKFYGTFLYGTKLTNLSD
jgi:hypothetical protein